MTDDKIFIDGDFNNSYASRTKAAGSGGSGKILTNKTMSKNYMMGDLKRNREKITVADPFVNVFDDKSAGPQAYNTKEEAVEECPVKWRDTTEVKNYSALTDYQKASIKNFPVKVKEAKMRHDD